MSTKLPQSCAEYQEEFDAALKGIYPDLGVPLLICKLLFMKGISVEKKRSIKMFDDFITKFEDI